MEKKASISHKTLIQVYPDRVRYYPGKVSTYDIIRGYKGKTDCQSMSEAADRLISKALSLFTPQEIAEFRDFAKNNR